VQKIVNAYEKYEDKGE